MATAAPPARRRASTRRKPTRAPLGIDPQSAPAIHGSRGLIRARALAMQTQIAAGLNHDPVAWTAWVRDTALEDRELERFAGVLSTTRSRRELEAWLTLVLTPRFWNAQLVTLEMQERRFAKDEQRRRRTGPPTAAPVVAPTTPTVPRDQGRTDRPAPRAAGRRASVGDGNGGSSGESDPDDPHPGREHETRDRGANVSTLPARPKWDEVTLPTDGAAYQAFRTAVADLAVLAHRWDVPLRAAVDIDALRSLAHECRRRDFGLTVRADHHEAEDRIADAIDAVAAWHAEGARRLRWVRYDIHEATHRTGSAA